MRMRSTESPGRSKSQSRRLEWRWPERTLPSRGRRSPLCREGEEPHKCAWTGECDPCRMPFYSSSRVRALPTAAAGAGRVNSLVGWTHSPWRARRGTRLIVACSLSAGCVAEPLHHAVVEDSVAGVLADGNEEAIDMPLANGKLSQARQERTSYSDARDDTPTCGDDPEAREKRAHPPS